MGSQIAWVCATVNRPGCNDPVKTCSGDNRKGDHDEHDDGRRRKEMDR
jgi:hypothetical protein